jgi:hypothetical protein
MNLHDTNMLQNLSLIWRLPYPEAKWFVFPRIKSAIVISEVIVSLPMRAPSPNVDLPYRYIAIVPCELFPTWLTEPVPSAELVSPDAAY